jgi:hypothetical protein
VNKPAHAATVGTANGVGDGEDKAQQRAKRCVEDQDDHIALEQNETQRDDTPEDGDRQSVTRQDATRSMDATAAAALRPSSSPTNALAAAATESHIVICRRVNRMHI